MKNMFSIITTSRYGKIFLVSFVLLFVVYTFLYGIWRIPLVEFGINRSSEVGYIDYTYIVSIASLSSLLITMIKYERTEKLQSGAKFASIGGAVAGVVSAICPTCQGIAILAFGGTIASLPLTFLVPYIGLFQLITIMILALALYVKADSIYTEKCIGCNIE